MFPISLSSCLINWYKVNINCSSQVFKISHVEVLDCWKEAYLACFWKPTVSLCALTRFWNYWLEGWSWCHVEAIRNFPSDINCQNFVRFLLEKAILVAQIASLRDVITLSRLVSVCASTTLNGSDHPRDKYLHLDRVQGQVEPVASSLHLEQHSILLYLFYHQLESQGLI